MLRTGHNAPRHAQMGSDRLAQLSVPFRGRFMLQADSFAPPAKDKALRHSSYGKRLISSGWLMKLISARFAASSGMFGMRSSRCPH